MILLYRIHLFFITNLTLFTIGDRIFLLLYIYLLFEFLNNTLNLIYFLPSSQEPNILSVYLQSLIQVPFLYIFLNVIYDMSIFWLLRQLIPIKFRKWVPDQFLFHFVMKVRLQVLKALVSANYITFLVSHDTSQLI